MKDTVAGVRMIDDNDNDPVTTSLLLANRPREIAPGMDGFVIMEGRNLPPGKTADNNGGVFVPTPRLGVGYGGSSTTGESYAYNYASTESFPVSHNSQSDEHNPYHASTVFVNLENNNGGGYRRTLLQDTNTTTGSSDKQQQNCLVVQGNMIITTASSSTTNNNTLYSKYENLEGRILDALARDVNAMKLGLPTNDVIVRLHMSSPYGFGAGSGGPTSSSSTVIATNMESSTNLNPLTASFWQQEYANIPYAMSILVCMTVLSLTLLALFVKTSRLRGQSKSKQIDNGKTITNWGVELDANRVLKDLHKANKEVEGGGDEENIPLSHSQSQEGMKDKLDNSKIAIVSGVGGVATKGRTGRSSSSRECTSSVKEKLDKSAVAAATTAVVAVASGVGVVAERIGRSLSPKRRTEKEEVELDAANRILKNLSKSNKEKSEDVDLDRSNVAVATTAAAAAAATTGMIGRLVSITKKDTPPKSKRAMSHDDTNSSESVASISIMIDSPKRTSTSTLGRRERSLVQDRSVHILDDLRWAKEELLPYDEELSKPTGEKGLVVAAAMTATAASVAAASAWKKTKTKVQVVAELTNTQGTSKPLFRDGIPHIVSPVRDAISRAVSPLSGTTTSADGENVEHQLRDYDSIIACDIVPVCVSPFLQRYAATEDEIETSWMSLSRGIWGTDNTNKPPAAVRLTSTNGIEKRGDRVRRNISNAVAAIDSRSKSPSRSRRSSKMDPPMAPIKKMDPSGGLIGKIRTRTTGKSSMDGKNTPPKVVSKKERLELCTEEDDSVVEFVEVDGFWNANGITNYFR
jgi:hypothetical protein